MKRLFADVYMGGSAADHDRLQKELQARYPWLDDNWEHEWRRAQALKQSQEAQTEEDLYEAQPQRPRSTILPLLWKVRAEREAGNHDAAGNDNSDGPHEETVQYSRNGDKTVTRDEKSVVDGVTQVKQTITRYDSEGNVRSRSVVTRGHSGEGDEVQTHSRSYSYSYAWGNRSQGANTEGENGAERQENTEGQPGDKKGWFWSSWN